MTDSRQIARAIEQARLDILEALFSGPEGQELIRLDAAYKALTGEEPRSLSEILAARNGQARVPTDALTVTDVHYRGPKEACRLVMRNGPMRVWDYDSLEQHFKDEGITLDAENPRDAIRTAMAALVREGFAVKVARGRFRPVRDVSSDNQRKGESIAGESGQGGASDDPSLPADGG